MFAVWWDVKGAHVGVFASHASSSWFFRPKVGFFGFYACMMLTFLRERKWGRCAVFMQHLNPFSFYGGASHGSEHYISSSLYIFMESQEGLEGISWNWTQSLTWMQEGPDFILGVRGQSDITKCFPTTQEFHTVYQDQVMRWWKFISKV